MERTSFWNHNHKYTMEYALNHVMYVLPIMVNNKACSSLDFLGSLVVSPHWSFNLSFHRVVLKNLGQWLSLLILARNMLRLYTTTCKVLGPIGFCTF